MIVKQCDICKQPVKPAITEAQANRNLGLHKRVVHGIKGAQSTPEGRREKARNRYRKRHGIPTADEVSDRKRAYQAEYRKALRARKKKDYPDNGDAKLKFICPNCQCRVYAAAAPE